MDVQKSLEPPHKKPDLKVGGLSGKGLNPFYLFVPRVQHMACHKAGTQYMLEVCMHARMRVWVVDRNVNY